MDNINFCELCHEPKENLVKLKFTIGNRVLRIRCCTDCDKRTLDERIVIFCDQCGLLGAIDREMLINNLHAKKDEFSPDSMEYLNIVFALRILNEFIFDTVIERKTISTSECLKCKSFQSISEQARLTTEKENIYLH